MESWEHWKAHYRLMERFGLFARPVGADHSELSRVGKDVCGETIRFKPAAMRY
jgi:hypothetical protein